jgi:hypothetical protein
LEHVRAAVLEARKRVSGIGVRQVRLTSGLILFSYLLSHFTNHALGIISLDVMEYGLRFHMGFWRSPVGTILLYPALTVHASLGLWALYQRRQFKWKSTELIQLIFGLSIPALLCWHLISQRVSVELYGLQKSYGQTLYAFWMVRPDLAAIQVILVTWPGHMPASAWGCGCDCGHGFRVRRRTCFSPPFCCRSLHCSDFISREKLSSSSRKIRSGLQKCGLLLAWAPRRSGQRS